MKTTTSIAGHLRLGLSMIEAQLVEIERLQQANVDLKYQIGELKARITELGGSFDFRSDEEKLSALIEEELSK